MFTPRLSSELNGLDGSRIEEMYLSYVMASI